MATLPAMLPGAQTPIERILGRFDRRTLSSFISVAIDLLDALGGDPDLEDNGDTEEDGTGDDQAYTEWQTRGRHKLAGGKAEPFDHSGEDSEDDDAPEDNHDREAIDEREPDEGMVNLPDGPCLDFGCDQSRGIGPDNPAYI